eukprot:7872078-Pyramimonas_sp.AAC.2
MRCPHPTVAAWALGPASDIGKQCEQVGSCYCVGVAPGCSEAPLGVGTRRTYSSLEAMAGVLGK